MTMITHNGTTFTTIPGFPDYYISKCGLVLSTKHGKLRILSPAVNSRGYQGVNLHQNGRTTSKLIHRLVGLTFLNAGPDDYVDHIDGDKLHNRLENLRLATRQQNMFNRKPNRNGSSPFKGVAWYAPRKRWQCKILHTGKKRHLGYFDCQVEAARAYDRAALELHGKFARLNFPLALAD